VKEGCGMGRDEIYTVGREKDGDAGVLLGEHLYR
jgi:hypothetical protein